MRKTLIIIGGLMLVISISSVCIILANDASNINGSFSMKDTEDWSEYWKIGSTLNCDVNLDMEIGPADLSGVAAHYMESGNPGWILADVNDNGSIGPEDLSGVAAHYMESY